MPKARPVRQTPPIDEALRSTTHGRRPVRSAASPERDKLLMSPPAGRPIRPAPRRDRSQL